MIGVVIGGGNTERSTLQFNMRISSSTINCKYLLFGVPFCLSLFLLGKNVIVSFTLAPRSEISTFEQNIHLHHDDKVKHFLTSNISVVVHLRGEMGNQLSVIASGFTVQQDLLKRYNIASHLVLRHQDSSKWIRAKTAVKKCFPNTRLFNFSAGNTQDFETQNKRQEQTYNLSSLLIDPTDDGLKYFYNIIKSKNEPTVPSDNNKISFPFLQVKEFSRKREEYYDEIRNFFQFDFESCCAQVPDDDEAIFHFRNFLYEMPIEGKKLGFEELDANRTANELFGHLHPGDKVAMLSRSRGNTTQYANAFQDRGLQFRFVTGQSGTEDFCFLLHSQADLAGAGLSTFFVWAVWLRNYTKPKHQSLVYWINSKQTRKRFASHPDKSVNFTYHPELASRIHYVAFDSSDENA